VRPIALLLLFVFINLQAKSENTDYFFEQVSSDAGFAYKSINSIVEDENGFVWFGSNNGLFYYNSSEIIKYNFDPENEFTPPSNNITKLYTDNNERLWICTDNGICYFNKAENSFTRLDLKESSNYLSTYNVSSVLQYSNHKYLIVINQNLYYFDINDQILWKVNLGDKNEVNYLLQNKNGDVFLGTTNGNVFINNESISDFRLFYASQSGLILTLSFFDNQLWIGFENNGIEVVSRAGNLESVYKEELGKDKHIANNRVRKIIKRKNGEIWVGTYDGISIINSAGNRTIKHNTLNGLPHSSIYELLIDKNDGIWVGTWAGGLAYYSKYNYRFPHIQKIINNEIVSKSVIASFAEDRDGNIWIGSETNGINKFDPDKKIFTDDKANNVQWPFSRIKSLTNDKNGRTWIGTFYEGLWLMENNQVSRIGEITGLFSSLLAVDNGIWIGSRERGLIYYDTKNKTFKRFRAEDKKIGSISSNNIWGIFQDSKENLWVCSNFGLSVKYKNTSDFERFFFNTNENSLSRNLIYSVAEDRNGNIWIGTSGGGIDIYDRENKSFNKFRLNEILKNADIYCILKDDQDNMWFSSNQGIYVYYLKDNVLKRFTGQDGLLGNQYQPISGFVSSKGKLFFGGGNGFNMIDPNIVIENQIVPEAFLSKLLINNQDIKTQKPKAINSVFLADIKKIELNYNQNSLTLGFAATNFIKTSKNKFKYRIEDYTNDWIEVNQGSDVSFAKIPPGNYVLEIMASNNDGLWSKTAKEIHIKIYPPFWFAWYAYLFYGILVTLILAVIIRELRFRTKSKADEFLFSEKVKFFTNVSHEFRTPLTLIISPLNNLKKKFINDPATMDHLNIVRRNADRLLRLTNQILDFRLIELNKVKLKRKNEDVVGLCKNVYDCFEYQIIEKDINCIFTSSYKSLNLAIDAEKIEKVVYNLLSNALKYSPEKGQIIFSIEQKTSLFQKKEIHRL